MKSCFFILILLMTSSLSFGAGYYNMMFGRSGITPFTWTGKSGDTNWSTAGNWHGGVAPGSSDTAVFDGRFCGTTCTVTINVSIDVGGISMKSSYAGTITQSSASSVIVRSSGWTQAGGTFVGSSSGDSIAITNNFILSGGSFTATTGLFKVENNFTVSNSPVFNHNSGIFVIDHNWGRGGKVISPGSIVLNHVQMNGGGYSYINVSGTMNVDGNLTITNDDARSSLNDGAIKLKGNLTVNDYGYSGDTLIELVGSSSQTVAASLTSPRLPGIKVASTGGTVNFADSVIITNNFTYTSGTVTVNSPVIYFAGGSSLIPGPIVFKDVEFRNGPYTYITITGTLFVSEDLTFNFSDNRASVDGGKIELKGNLSSTNSTHTGNTTILLNGSTNQSIGGTSTPIFPSIEIASTGGTVSFVNSFRVYGNFTYTSGTVDAGTTKVLFQSSAITPGPINFYDVAFENGAYVNTNITGSLNVTRDVEFSAVDGRSGIDGGPIYIGRNATFTTNLNNVRAPWVLNGNSTQLISAMSGNFTQGNITVNNPSSAVTLGSNIPMTFSGQTLTVNNGSVNMAGFNLDVNALSLNGNTLTKAGGALTVNGTTVGTGSGIYGGTVAP